MFLVQDLLTHIIKTIEYKGITTIVLVILSKVISLVKTVYSEEEAREKRNGLKIDDEMEVILRELVSILFVLINKKGDDAMILRIIQTTYSLIEPTLLVFADYNITMRLYSICFRCCLTISIVQNISTP